MFTSLESAVGRLTVQPVSANLPATSGQMGVSPVHGGEEAMSGAGETLDVVHHLVAGQDLLQLRGALASQRSLAAQLATIGQASASTAMASLGRHHS
jgi:hypothetical protein